MHLVIHDASLRKVAFVDNTKQNTLKYVKYEWYRSLETAGSTFNVTIQKKAIQTDNHYEVAYNHLNERSFITFKAKNKTHLFSVMVVTENEETITCECESANLELINEYANPYKATKAMTFVEYCNAMGLLSFTYLTIGLNEVSDKKLTLEWEGQDTKLARLLSLANKFDAEIEFDTRLNADSSIKQFILNVYHKNDDTHQGVGRIREDVRLVYGKNIKSVTRTIDKTNVVNAIRPTGTKDGNTVVISGLGAWEEKNAEGIVEFYQKGEMLYAPISMQLYPSAFVHDTTNDQWTRKDITVDSDNPTVIRAEGIKALKRLAYPSITYEVDGFFDGEIGDTVKVIDNGFVPKLILKARVIEQYIYDDETKNKTVLGNFTALENRLSDGIQERLNELIEQAKPYTIKLSTDSGVVFKNNIGQSIVTPRLYKGGQQIVNDVTWRWALDGNVTTGMTYTVLGSNVTDTVILTVSAYVGNDEVVTDDVSFVNVVDGADGQTAVVHWAYSDNADGTGLTLTDNGQRYMGNYSDYTQADSTDKTKYRWADRWAKIDIDTRNLWIQSQTTGWFITEALPSGHVTGQNLCYKILNWGDVTFNIEPDFSSRLYRTVTFSAWIKYENVVQGPDSWNVFNCFKHELIRKNSSTGAVTSADYFTLADLTGTSDWKYVTYTFDYSANTSYDQLKTSIKFNLEGVTTGVAWITGVNIQLGTVDTGHSLAPEDIQKEIDSKADQTKVVYKTDISVTDEGIVHSASKTVNGQTIASMIAQRAEWVEIIANLLKVKGDMIVDGTIGANKLSVSTLSALAADLGKISGGSLELLKSEAQATSVDAWGNFTIPAHKWGLYIDNIGAISSGTPVRKSSSESTASDMPVGVLSSGQLLFAMVNQNNDLESVLHYGLSDPDNATISFDVAPDGTKRLLIQANGQIVNKGTNYTGWTSTGVSGVFYKRQGDVVALKMQVTTTANQSLNLGKIPVSLLPIQNAGTMMRVTAWTGDQSFGRNLQISSDGSMALLQSSRGDTFNTQVTWII